MLKDNSDDAAMLNNFANLLFQLSDKDAQKYAEQAVKLRPNNAAFSDTLGWILVNTAQQENGLRYLREARLRNPNSVEIRYHLAYALARNGRKGEAIEEFRAASAMLGDRVTDPEHIQLKKELGL